MKKITIAIAFLMMVSSLWGQADDLHGYAIIEDKDGFTNIRQEPNAKSKIVGTIKEDDIFYYFSDKGQKEWYSIYRKNNKKSGYVHKSRVKSLVSLPYVVHKKAVKDTLFFKNDSIDAKIIINTFIPKQHKIEKKNNFIFKIDGKEPRGRDGGLPNTGIKNIQVKIGDNVVDIPQSELDDLFQPSFGTPTIYIGQKETIFLEMSGGDGAGYYEVAFVIKNRKYVKRYVFYSF
jgi:hypothetical protein